MKDKNLAMKKYRRTLDEDDRNISSFLKKHFKSEFRKAKKKYHLDKFKENKNNPKAYWRTINSLVNPKVSNPVFNLIDKENNNQQIANSDTADFINTYFATIGDKLAANMNERWTPLYNTIPPNFVFVNCTTDDIKQLIKKINCNKSSGIINISIQVIKDTFLTLPLHLKFIINLVLTTSTFPDTWKHAIVTPLPKGGDTSDVNNLRPISILSIMAKRTHSHTYLTC